MSFIHNILNKKQNGSNVEQENYNGPNVVRYHVENYMDDAWKTYKTTEKTENTFSADARNSISQLKNKNNVSNKLRQNIKANERNEADMNSNNNIYRNINNNYNNVVENTRNGSHPIYKSMTVEEAEHLNNFNKFNRGNSFLGKKNGNLPVVSQNKNTMCLTPNTQDQSANERNKCVTNKNITNSGNMQIGENNSVPYTQHLELKQFHNGAKDMTNQSNTVVYGNVCNKTRNYIDNGNIMNSTIKNTAICNNNNNNNNRVGYNLENREQIRNNKDGIPINGIYIDDNYTMGKNRYNKTTPLNLNQTHDVNKGSYKTIQIGKGKTPINNSIENFIKMKKIDSSQRQVSGMKNYDVVNPHVSCNDINSQRKEFCEQPQKRMNSFGAFNKFNIRSLSGTNNMGEMKPYTNFRHTNEINEKHVEQNFNIDMNSIKNVELNNFRTPTMLKHNYPNTQKRSIRSSSSLIRPAHLIYSNSTKDNNICNYENNPMNKINNFRKDMKQSTSPILKVEELKNNKIETHLENHSQHQNNYNLHMFSRARIGSEVSRYGINTTNSKSHMELNRISKNNQIGNEKRKEDMPMNVQNIEKLQVANLNLTETLKNQTDNRFCNTNSKDEQNIKQKNIINKNDLAHSYHHMQQGPLIGNTFHSERIETAPMIQHGKSVCRTASSFNCSTKINKNATMVFNEDVYMNQFLHKIPNTVKTGNENISENFLTQKQTEGPIYKNSISNNQEKFKMITSNKIVSMDDICPMKVYSSSNVSQHIINDKEYMPFSNCNKNSQFRSNEFYRESRMHMNDMSAENETTINRTDEKENNKDIQKTLENKKIVKSDLTNQEINKNNIHLVKGNIGNVLEIMENNKTTIETNGITFLNPQTNVTAVNAEIKKEENKNQKHEITQNNSQKLVNENNKKIVADMNGLRKVNSSLSLVKNDEANEIKNIGKKGNIYHSEKIKQKPQSFSSLCKQFEEITEECKKMENDVSKNMLYNENSNRILENKQNTNVVNEHNYTEKEKETYLLKSVSSEFLKSSSNASYKTKRKESHVSDDTINPETYRLMDDEVLTDTCVHHFKNKKKNLKKRKENEDSEMDISEQESDLSILNSEKSENEISEKSNKIVYNDNCVDSETKKKTEVQIDKNKKSALRSNTKARKNDSAKKNNSLQKRKTTYTTTNASSAPLEKIVQMKRKDSSKKKWEQNKIKESLLKESKTCFRTSNVKSIVPENDEMDSDDFESDDEYDSDEMTEEEEKEENEEKEKEEEKGNNKKSLKENVENASDKKENNNSITFPWDKDVIIKIRKKKNVKSGASIIMNTKLARYERVLIHTCVSNLKWKKCNDNANKGNFHWVGYNINDADHFNYMKKKKIINRIPSIYMYTKKKALTFLLSHLSFIYPQLFNFYPTTFVLPENKNILKYVLNNNNNNDYYIMKPDGGSMGLGVKLINKFSDINSNILNGYNSYVIQKYIDSPLLMYKKKFDFRIYALLIPGKKYPKIFLSRVGFARLCTEEYKKKKKYIGNTFVHLTNYSINKDNNKYIRKKNIHDKNNNKQLLSDVFIYLKENGYDTDDIWKQMKKICCLTSLAMYSYLKTKIKYNYKNNFNFYQLIGLDIILDDSGKAWLLEVNSNPSLRIDYIDPSYSHFEIQLESMFDRYVKEPLISEMFHIVYKKIYKKYFIKKKEKKTLQNNSSNNVKTTLSNNNSENELNITNNFKNDNTLLRYVSKENKMCTNKEYKLTEQKNNYIGSKMKHGGSRDPKANNKKEKGKENEIKNENCTERNNAYTSLEYNSSSSNNNSATSQYEVATNYATKKKGTSLLPKKEKTRNIIFSKNKNISNSIEGCCTGESDVKRLEFLSNLTNDQMKKEGEDDSFLLQKDDTPKKVNKKCFRPVCSVGRAVDFEEDTASSKRTKENESDIETEKEEDKKTDDKEDLSNKSNTKNKNAEDCSNAKEKYECYSYGSKGSSSYTSCGSNHDSKLSINNCILEKGTENETSNNSLHKIDCSSNNICSHDLYFNKECYADSELGTRRDVFNCRNGEKSANLERNINKQVDTRPVKDIEKVKNIKNGSKICSKEIEKSEKSEKSETKDLKISKKMNKEKRNDPIIETTCGNKEAYVQINDHIDVQLDKILNTDLESYKTVYKNISDSVYKRKIENMILIRSNLYKYMNCLNVLGIRYVNKDIKSVNGTCNNYNDNYNNCNNIINGGGETKKTFTKIRKDILHPLKNDILEKNVYVYLKRETNTYYNNMELYNRCLFLYEYVLKKYDNNLKKKKKKFEYYIDKTGFICMCKDLKINKLVENIEISNMGTVYGKISEAHKNVKDKQMYQIVKELLKADQSKNEKKKDALNIEHEETDKNLIATNEKSSSNDYYHLENKKKNNTKNKNVSKKQKSKINGSDICDEENSLCDVEEAKDLEKTKIENNTVTTTRASEKRNNSYCCSSENVLDSRKRNASSSYYVSGFCPFSFNSSSNTLVNLNNVGINNLKQIGKKKKKMNMYDLEFLFTRQIFFNKYMNKSLGLTVIDFFLLMQQLALLIFPYINNFSVYNIIHPYNNTAFEELNAQEQYMFDPIINEETENGSTRVTNGAVKTSIAMLKKFPKNKKKGETQKEQIIENKVKNKNSKENLVKDRKYSDKKSDKNGIMSKIPLPVDLSAKTENSLIQKNEEKKKDPNIWHKNICNNITNLYEYTQIHVKTELKNICLETLLIYVFNKYGLTYAQI